MSEKTVIAVDAMGGDNAPQAVVQGSVEALENADLKILLVGKAEEINAELSKLSYDKSRIEVVDAREVISTSEPPTTAIKKKKDSSMVVCMNLVKEGKAKALVSAGNSGALLAGSTLLIGRIKGVERPVLGTPLPNAKGFTFLVDSGANVDCKPSYLVQFAKMGSIYMEKVRGIENPRVGLVNIGAEKEKGNALTKETYDLLSEVSGINFIGNVEPREIPSGACDVAVCDAFVGNTILKYTEGLTTSLLGMIKDELMSSTISKIGAALSRGAFKNLKKRFSYDDIGGAPFLGLKEIVIKAHGSSNSRAIKGAINQGYMFASLGLSGEIAKYCGILNEDGE